MSSVENCRFFETFLTTRGSFQYLACSKQVGNCRTRKSETSTFQNFFPIEKILIFKKIRSIFVWIEVIFSCSSVYLKGLLSKRIGFQVLQFFGRTFFSTGRIHFRFGLEKLYGPPNKTYTAEGKRRSFDIQILKFSIFHIINVKKTLLNLTS